MQCFLCHNNQFKQIYSLKNKDIVSCKNDGLFLAKIIKDYKTYGLEYFANVPNAFNQKYFLKKLDSIKRATEKRKPRILDVGCGWGDFEEVLERENIPYLGIDANKEAVDICRKKGLNCKKRTIQEYSGKSDHKYDCITLFQVIEHLKNPAAAIRVAKKLLKPRGVILLTTPNNDTLLRKLMGARWSVYTEPSHFVFFDKTTLYKTLGLAGFKNIQVKIDSPRFLSLKYVLNRLTTKPFTLIPDLPVPTDPFGDLEAWSTN